MTAQILDGKALGQKLRAGFKQRAEELAAHNAALRVDPRRDEIWPCHRPRGQVRALLDGTAPVVWVAPAKAGSDEPPSLIPAVLAGRGFRASSVVRADKWFVVTLIR